VLRPNDNFGVNLPKNAGFWKQWLPESPAAWNFRDEVLRWLFHGNSLSDPRDLLIPFFGKFGLVVDPELQVERRELDDNVVLTFNQRHSSTLVAFRSSYWPKLHIHLEIGTVSAHKRALQAGR
jgi:hypothetical protein